MCVCVCVGGAFLDVPIELPFYDDIAKNLSNFEMLARYFDMDPKEFEDKQKKHERKIAFLSLWKQGEASNATYKALVDGLHQIVCNDDAEKICKLVEGELYIIVAKHQRSNGITSAVLGC